MLEFDDTKRGVLKPADDGYVVLPISDYNELLRRADAAYNAITLSRREYTNSKPIEATVDKHWLYRLAMEKLLDLYSPNDLEGYELTRRPDDLIVFDFTLAKLCKRTQED